jgi:hypothetical protein
MKEKSDIDNYVRAAAQLHGVTLSEEQFQRIASNFQLTAVMVEPLLAFPISVLIDPAPVFRA